MNQSELLAKFNSEFSDMENLANSFDEAAFFKQPHAEKWSVAQNLVHLNFVAKNILGALSTPAVLTGFGKANRASRDFDTIRDAYLSGLSEWQAKGMPYKHLNTEGPKISLLQNFKAIHQNLMTHAASLSEDDLDSFQLPHPVLGLMTVREMLGFAAYHIRHHYEIIEKINV
jgi:DinB superfamily